MRAVVVAVVVGGWFCLGAVFSRVLCYTSVGVADIICCTDCRKKYEQNEAKRKAQYEMARNAAAATNGGK